MYIVCTGQDLFQTNTSLFRLSYLYNSTNDHEYMSLPK